VVGELDNPGGIGRHRGLRGGRITRPSGSGTNRRVERLAGAWVVEHINILHSAGAEHEIRWPGPSD